MSDNKKYYFAFSLVENLGPISFQKIKKYFPDLKFAWQASGSELIKAGVTDKVVSEIIDIKNKIITKPKAVNNFFICLVSN